MKIPLNFGGTDGCEILLAARHVSASWAPAARACFLFFVAADFPSGPSTGGPIADILSGIEAVLPAIAEVSSTMGTVMSATQN